MERVMADRNHEVHVQAKAFVDGLSKLTAKERAQTPKGHFGQQFNQLRSLAMEVRTDLEARSWPPEIVVRATGQRELLCEATYAEIETYARVILGHFPLELASGF